MLIGTNSGTIGGMTDLKADNDGTSTNKFKNQHKYLVQLIEQPILLQIFPP